MSETITTISLADKAKEAFKCNGAQSVLEALNFLGALFLEMKLATD